MDRLKKAIAVFKNALAITFLVLLGLLVITQFRYVQSKPDVFVQDDTYPQTLNETVCTDENTRLFGVASWMSLRIYPDIEYKPEDFKDLYSSWEKIVEEDDEKYGFPFAVWKNETDKIYFIAFKGTTPTSLVDWRANLHWLLKRVGSDQYVDVKNNIDKIITEHIGDNSDSYKIYTTGHSLGGGLAQHALYQNKQITEAYVFNSSGVTGWSDFEIETLKGNEYLQKGEHKKSNICVSGTACHTTIYRVHETGEVLEFFRLFMKGTYLFNPEPNRHPYVKEYQVNFDEEKMKGVTQHSIESLAKGFASVKCK